MGIGKQPSSRLVSGSRWIFGATVASDAQPADTNTFLSFFDHLLSTIFDKKKSDARKAEVVRQEMTRVAF